MIRNHFPQPSWPGLSRPSTSFLQQPRKTWMAGTGPGMTNAGMTNESPAHKIVMRGLDPRIHPLPKKILSKRWICRVKPGNDEF